MLSVAIIVALGLLATTLYNAPAEAQGGNLVTETVVGKNSGHVWKSMQDGVDQGTAWRQPGFDDSAWLDEPLKFYAAHGLVNNNGEHAYYFREDFTIENVHEIVGIKAELYYDDAAIMYINGVEVYRTIRNNLPTTAEVPAWTTIQFGGAEDYYVVIPAESNYCEAGCLDDGATNAIDPSVLVEGTNTIALMAWTRPTSDLGVDLGLDVVRDLDTPLPNAVVINEVVASNATHTDFEGDTPDWFELYNPGATEVELQGWTISDNTGQWKLPAIEIEPGQHLVIFASGKDITAGNELHTSFKLSKEGDSLKLVDAEGIVRDEYTTMPRQVVDVPFGLDAAGEVTYLGSPTPGQPNAARAIDLQPVLRPFSGRLFNVGDAVDLQLDGFDPDGDSVTFTFNPLPPGFSIDETTGAITGTATTAGSYTVVARLTDADNNVASQFVTIEVIDAPTMAPGIVLNEYNAVPSSSELAGGSDVALGPVLGNGGDWYEFLVVEDRLDLRGWTIELWDRDRDEDLGDYAASLTFSNDSMLSGLPAGMLITISEDMPDDFDFNRTTGDWHINLQADDFGQGSMFSVQESFNSTRSDQHVIIRDAAGNLRSPIVGETEAWDTAIGGVGSGEVMNLCANPDATSHVDPVADYRDNSVSSTFGLANQCVHPDAVDPASLVTFDQDLSALRASAVLSGDADCDGALTVNDSYAIAQFAVGLRTGVTSCPLTTPGAEINTRAADVDFSGDATVNDSSVIARCAVGFYDAGCSLWN